jgi:aerobic carbon-monoxide dehydrogenase small subunit
MESSKQVRLDINGQSHELTVDCRSTLNELLRNRLGLFGTKLGCNYGGCGNCTVLMAGKPVYSCSILAVEAEGTPVTTIEGLSGEGELHPIQEAFAEQYAAQCGWCTPGMIMAAKALLDQKPNPTVKEVKTALSGVLCRCTGYTEIVKAVLEAAKIMQRQV